MRRSPQDSRRSRRRRSRMSSRSRSRPITPTWSISNMKKADRAGKVSHRLEPEQRREDHDRALLAARTRAPDGGGAAHVGRADDPHLAHLRFDEVLERAGQIGDPMAALGYSRGRAQRRLGAAHRLHRQAHGGRTPEPVPENPLGAAPSVDKPIFVIQEHHASASPLGLPPRARRCAGQLGGAARRTPHHEAQQPGRHDRRPPDGLRHFRGNDPAGEYGGGTVTIWDDGHYDLEKWRDDEVIATLRAVRADPSARVRLALIRTDGRARSRVGSCTA